MVEFELVSFVSVFCDDVTLVSFLIGTRAIGWVDKHWIATDVRTTNKKNQAHT